MSLRFQKSGTKEIWEPIATASLYGLKGSGVLAMPDRYVGKHPRALQWELRTRRAQYTFVKTCTYMVVSLNYCSQNGGNVYRDPHYNGNPNIGPRTIGNLDQYPHDTKILNMI